MSLQSQKWAYLDVVPVPPKLNLLMTPDPKRSKGVAEKKKQTLEVSMRLLTEYFGWRSKWNHFLLLHTPRNTSLKYWMTCFKIQSKGFLYQKETIRQVWSYCLWTEGDAAYYSWKPNDGWRTIWDPSVEVRDLSISRHLVGLKSERTKKNRRITP